MRMTTLLGGASAYAHLAGLVPVRGKGRRAEDEDTKPKDGKRSRAAEEDDDQDDEPKGRKSRAEEDPDQYPDDDDSKPQGRAEDDDKDPDAEEDEDEDKSARRARRARADDDEDDKSAEDDDDKEEMSGKSAVAKARARERARCKAIFSHPVAAQNVALAASLAFDTTMTRKEAVAVLKGQQGQGGTRDYRGDRSRRNPDLGPGGEAAPTGAKALSGSWDRALASASVPVRR